MGVNVEMVIPEKCICQFSELVSFSQQLNRRMEGKGGDPVVESHPHLVRMIISNGMHHIIL